MVYKRKIISYNLTDNDYHFSVRSDLVLSTHLRKLVETRKNKLIHELLQHGIFKSSEKQLYELSLSELEKEHKDSIQMLPIHTKVIE